MQLEVGMYSFSLSLQLDRGFIILKQTYNIGNIKKKKDHGNLSLWTGLVHKRPLTIASINTDSSSTKYIKGKKKVRGSKEIQRACNLTAALHLHLSQMRTNATLYRVWTESLMPWEALYVGVHHISSFTHLNLQANITSTSTLRRHLSCRTLRNELNINHIPITEAWYVEELKFGLKFVNTLPLQRPPFLP